MFPFYWLAEMVARSGGDSASSVIKLDTVRRIAELVTFSYYIELMLSVLSQHDLNQTPTSF